MRSQSKYNGPKEITKSAKKNRVIGINKNTIRKQGIPKIQL